MLIYQRVSPIILRATGPKALRLRGIQCLQLPTANGAIAGAGGERWERLGGVGVGWQNRGDGMENG
jgi:hypothetical protein